MFVIFFFFSRQNTVSRYCQGAGGVLDRVFEREAHQLRDEGAYGVADRALRVADGSPAPELRNGYVAGHQSRVGALGLVHSNLL